MNLAATSNRISPAAQVLRFPPAAKTAESRFYRPELDLLRFCAFLAVFLHHSLPGIDPSHAGRAKLLWKLIVLTKESGSFGVCLFFLLSAYLITELLQREHSRTGAVHVRSFYIRRALRIWPLYFIFLAAGVALGCAISAYRVEGRRLLAFILLSGNWYAATAGFGASPIAPLWSISVEEQFYLLWPWFAKLGRIVLWRAAGLVLLISCCGTMWLSLHHSTAPWKLWANSLVQFQFFAAGALLALSLRGRTPSLGRYSRLTLLLTGALLWAVAQSALHVKDGGGPPQPVLLPLGYLCINLGCVLLLLSFLGIPQARVPRSLAHLGRISYGLYVFHLLCLDCAWKLVLHGRAQLGELSPSSATAHVFAIEVAAFLFTIALASLSYKYLESPFLRTKQRFTFIPSRAI